MVRANSIEIDGNKLKDELRIRGLNHSEAGRKMHCSESFIATTIRKNKLGRDKMLLMQTILGISEESIRPDPKPEPEPEPLKAEEKGAEQMSIQEMLELCREIKEASSAKADGPGLEAVIHAIDKNMLPVREMVEAVRNRAFRVATMTDMSEGHIANGVKNGMDAWWKAHSSDVQGAIYAGVYNALVKYWEFRNTKEIREVRG